MAEGAHAIGPWVAIETTTCGAERRDWTLIGLLGHSDAWCRGDLWIKKKEKVKICLKKLLNYKYLKQNYVLLNSWKCPGHI